MEKKEATKADAGKFDSGKAECSRVEVKQPEKEVEVPKTADKSSAEVGVRDGKVKEDKGFFNKVNDALHSKTDRSENRA